MFTGLIEKLGRVSTICRYNQAMQLGIELGDWVEQCKIGDSIAVNGACLTITRFESSSGIFDVSSETLACTTLGGLSIGSFVNLERAIKADGRFGGHFVLGHIDGIASLNKIERAGGFANMRFTMPTELLNMLVPKGSVAVDGISLTVAKLDDTGFSVAVIPQTMEKTTLGKIKIGDKVNIEIDIIMKIVKQQLERMIPAERGLTIEKLKQMGF